VIDQATPSVIVTNMAAAPLHCGNRVLMPGVPQHVDLQFVADYGSSPGVKIDWSPLMGSFRGRANDGRLALDFWCPLSVIDGYGRHALDIYRGMQMLGADVTLRASTFVDRNFLPVEYLNSVAANRSVMPAQVSVSMSVPYDPIHSLSQSPTRIIITQFETDRFPPKHVEVVNRCHQMIVTTTFGRDLMRHSGVRIPIAVMTPGLDTDLFKPPVKPREIDGTFRVLMHGALTPRKNPLGAIRIFQRASQGNPAWRLTIKTRNASGLPEVRRQVAGDNRIQMRVSDDPPMSLPWLYGQHDAFLWPSKGEGCGLPPLEAMACGLEVVSSNNSGMRDFISDEFAWPIKTAHMEYAGPPHGFESRYVSSFGDVGNWWVPDEDHGTRQLAAVYDAWLSGRGKGKQAANYVRTRHNLRTQAASVLQVVEKYV
jgi:glycosyltransferase involved in cell wall biosynthesis